MMNRRRFLGITASLGAMAMAAQWRTERYEWRGFGFGGEIGMTLMGDKARAKAAMPAVQAKLESLENTFSLFREKAEISRLNGAGFLDAPSSEMRELLGLSKHIWRVSEGRFDPSIQRLWRARAMGINVPERPDFGAVEIGPKIILHGQELTLNGIAQGYAADQISTLLRQYGFHNTLVNLGEFRAEDDHWRLAIENQDGRILRHITLSGAALATSSALSDSLQNHSHILSADGAGPVWKTVSVVADSGATADGWSTAMMLMRPEEIAELDRAQEGIRQVIAESPSGEIVEFG